MEKSLKNKSNGVILTISLATLFGLGAGLTSAIMLRSYLMDEIYNIPFYGEVNFSQDKLHKANLIIENAKKIIVEQDAKVISTIDSAEKNLVGIFEKNKISSSTTDLKKEINLNEHYKLSEEIAQGIIMTSDGWVIADNFIENYDKTKSYVAITKDKKIYEIDQKTESGILPYLFIHLKDARELPVKSFAKRSNLTNGQLAVAVSWDNKGYLTSIISKKENGDEFIFSSDKPAKGFVLGDGLEEYFNIAFIFNLSGEIAGLFDKEWGVTSIDYFQPAIKNLLEKKEIKLPSLGIHYVNLNEFASSDEKIKNGALIYEDAKNPGIEENSSAEIAGLKNGDIIISINNTKIDEDNILSDIIQGYMVDDEIDITYLRNGEERIAKAILKEFKK